ncbi:MAG: TIGR04255 family protein [Bradyrhizobium sp.]
MTDHPSYAKPTIVEVTCEIAFVRQSSDRFSSRSLYALFGDEFPEMQTLIGNMNLQIFVGPPGAIPPAVQASPQAAVGGFRLGNAANNEFIQVSGANFVYQLVGGTYPGWPALKEKLLDHWSKIKGEVKPAKLIKIGLRYVNLVAKEPNHTHLGDWLQPSADLPPTLIASEGHFLARIESSPSAGHLKLVSLGNQDPGISTEHGGIIFDIDRICQEGEIPMDTISEKLEILHDDVWTTFDSAKTPLLHARLRGE